jgi:poly-gamma-glutamate synthesis protein (capsule biosynthesis protein)
MRTKINKFLREARDYQLAAAGDVFLKTNSNTKPFSDSIQKCFNKAEVQLVNLETALTDYYYPKKKAFPIQANPNMVTRLNDIGHRVIANLANNHTLDCGQVGLQDTVRNLERLNICHVGVVVNSLPQDPTFIELSSGKLGIIGYTIGNQIINGIGVATIDEVQIIQDIHRVKKMGADWILVNLHWGVEYTAFPSPSQQRLAREIIDAGADIILGSHPHMIQGIEHYKQGIVFYSLGNLNFYTPFDEGYPKTKWGMIVLINFGNIGISYEIVPTWTNSNYQPELMPDSKVSDFKHYLEQISIKLIDRIPHLFWLDHASVPYFQSNFRGFKTRIENYGLSHAVAMFKWLFRPSTYLFCLGLLMRAVRSIVGKIR